VRAEAEERAEALEVLRCIERTVVPGGAELPGLFYRELLQVLEALACAPRQQALPEQVVVLTDGLVAELLSGQVLEEALHGFFDGRNVRLLNDPNLAGCLPVSDKVCGGGP